MRAIVKIKPVRPLAIETFKEFPEIGRFALRDMGTTIAGRGSQDNYREIQSKQEVSE